MQKTYSKQIVYSVALLGPVLFLQGCSDSPDCASKSATNALIEKFKANPQNELFQSIPLHIPLFLNSGAHRGSEDALSDQLCADYKRLCAIANERNSIIKEISERQRGAENTNNCDTHDEFLKKISSEMDSGELATNELKKLDWLKDQEENYKQWKAEGYQPAIPAPEKQTFAYPNSTGGPRGSKKTAIGQTEQASRPIAIDQENTNNACPDVNQLSRQAEMLSVYLEHEVTQARVSDAQKHDAAVSKGSFDFDNIVTEGKSAETGAVACRADLKLSVKGWGETEGKISYRVEKASNGKIITSLQWLD